MRAFFTAMLTLILIAVFNNQAQADVYAGQLKVYNPDTTDFDGNFQDGSGALLTFFLNDTASSVMVEIVDAGDGSVAHTIDAGSHSRGFKSIMWDGTGSISGHDYILRVTAEQSTASSTEWTVFYDSGGISIFTRGGAVVTDQSDPNFGKLFTSNDGGPLQTGINIYNTDGSFHDPFLVAGDVSVGGNVNWGTDAPLFAVLDEQGRLYCSAKDLGQVIRVNRDFSTDILIDNLTFPKGLYVSGDGADFTMYIAADNKILRGNIGTANSFPAASLETVADFSGFFPQQINLDDDGALYTTLRESNDLGSNGKGIRKFDISGTLPVTDNDAAWVLTEDLTFLANDLLFDYGDDRNSSADDILYYVTRAGSNFDQDGVWRINDINSFFPDTVRIVTEDKLYGSDENVNARSAIDFDAAGNIVLLENSNEHIFFLSPPGDDATNSFTSSAADTFRVDVALGIDDGVVSAIDGYSLKANYPNPFNPDTKIEFSLGKSGETSIKVFNMLGEEVTTLKQGFLPAGDHAITWNGRNAAGRQVASGVYILQLRSGAFLASQRMILSK